MACVRHAHLPPHRAARLIAEARQLHARKALPPFPLRPLPHPQRREISAAHPAPGWEVWLYAVLAAKFALRDEQASTVDEAVFAQRVDAAVAGLEGSLITALGLRRKANKEVAARELDDVVQVRGSLRNGYPSRAVGGCALDRPTPCPAMPPALPCRRSCAVPRICSADRGKTLPSCALRGLWSTLPSRLHSSSISCTGSCSRRTPTAAPAATGGGRAGRQSALC